MVQMASLQQLALPALLLLGRNGAAFRRCRSRDRHFARVFASTVVNAADADHVCLWHRMAMCSAHGYAGPIVPRRGGTALLGMQLGKWARMAPPSSPPPPSPLPPSPPTPSPPPSSSLGYRGRRHRRRRHRRRRHRRRRHRRLRHCRRRHRRRIWVHYLAL